MRMRSQVHYYSKYRELRMSFTFYLHNLNLQHISRVLNTLYYLTWTPVSPATDLLPVKPLNVLCVLRGFLACSMVL